MGSPSLDEDFADRFSGFASHLEWALGRREDNLVVWKPHRSGDGSIEVGCGSLFGDDVGCRFVGFSVNGSTFDAGTGKSKGEGFWEVIPSGVIVDFRGSSKFGSNDHEGAFQKSTLFEVSEKGGIRLVKDGKLFVGFCEVIGVPVEPAKLDFNKANAVLNETPGEQNTFAKFVTAISGVGILGLRREVEGFKIF